MGTKTGGRNPSNDDEDNRREQAADGTKEERVEKLREIVEESQQRYDTRAHRESLDKNVDK